MNKPIVVGVAALAAVIAAVVSLRNDSTESSAPPAAASTTQSVDGEPATAAVVQSPAVSAGAATSSPAPADARPVPSDPRLTAPAVSPSNDLIEFVPSPDGRIIKEIDKDPASAGFNKPSREYMYSRGKVTGLTTYRYLGDRVEITQTAVSYKPDGSIDQLIDKTSYRDEKPNR